MKFNDTDIDLEIKRTKLEILKLLGGLLSAVMIALVVGAAAGLGWLVMAVF